MPYKQAFAVAACMNLSFAFFHLFAVKDPNLKQLRKRIDSKLFLNDKQGIEEK
jgi:hypothetical protein